MDEDGFLRQCGGDIFEYNLVGLFIKVYNWVGGWSVRYCYDGLGWWVFSKSSYSYYLQFFYVDLINFIKVIYFYNYFSFEIIFFYYDL